MEVKKHKILYKTYTVGFADGNKTQFDVKNISELGQLWSDFCEENHIDPNSVTYIEFAGYTDHTGQNKDR